MNREIADLYALSEIILVCEDNLNVAAICLEMSRIVNLKIIKYFVLESQTL